MKMKVFFDGLEPGVYNGTLAVDTDGNMFFETGEPIVTECIGNVSVSMPTSLYTQVADDHVDITDKSHPRFIAGYKAGLKDGTSEQAEDARAAYVVGIEGQLDYWKTREALTIVGLFFTEKGKHNFANYVYAVLDYVNRMNKELAEALSTGDALRVAIHQIDELEKRVSDAKNTILDAADQIAQMDKELIARQTCLDATAIAANRHEACKHEAEDNRDYWKSVAVDRAAELNKAMIKIAELQRDIEIWKNREADTHRAFNENRDALAGEVAINKNLQRMINERNEALHAIRKALDTPPQRADQPAPPAPWNA